MMTYDEMIAVIQAAKEGKHIQSREINGNHWHGVTPNFDFSCCDYRVKPEPRSLWVVRYDDGSVYDTIEVESEALRCLVNNPTWTMHEYREVLP